MLTGITDKPWREPLDRPRTLQHCGGPDQTSLRSGGALRIKASKETERPTNGQRLQRRPDTRGVEWLSYLRTRYDAPAWRRRSFTPYLPQALSSSPPLPQPVIIILNSTSSTGSPTSCRVSFPLFAGGHHTRSSPNYLITTTSTAYHHLSSRRASPARVYSTNHQAIVRIP